VRIPLFPRSLVYKRAWFLHRHFRLRKGRRVWNANQCSIDKWVNLYFLLYRGKLLINCTYTPINGGSFSFWVISVSDITTNVFISDIQEIISSSIMFSLQNNYVYFNATLTKIYWLYCINVITALKGFFVFLKYTVKMHRIKTWQFPTNTSSAIHVLHMYAQLGWCLRLKLVNNCVYVNHFESAATPMINCAGQL